MAERCLRRCPTRSVRAELLRLAEDTARCSLPVARRVCECRVSEAVTVSVSVCLCDEALRCVLPLFMFMNLGLGLGRGARGGLTVHVVTRHICGWLQL